MWNIRRVLVAVKDPGNRTSAAIAKGAELAGATGASLELFHALAEPLQAAAFVSTRASVLAVERRMRDQSLAALEHSARRLRARGMEVTTSVEWDFPAYEAIVRRALRMGADVVVAEPHAGRRLVPWFPHLNDWELIRMCPVPVLIVRSERAYRRRAMLASLDPTHAFAKSTRLDREILRTAAAVADALGGRLHAMHAYLPVPPIGMIHGVMSGGVLRNLESDTVAMARRGFERELKKAGIPASRRHLVRNAAVEAIPDVARRIRAGLVVMGAISRSGLRRVFIGNTAERVLARLPCDVLVVKPPRFRSPVPRARRGVRLVTALPPMPY